MKKRFALAALLAVAPFAVPAQALSYTFIEGGFSQVSVDTQGGGEDPDIDGGYARGSVAITDNLSVFGQYARAKGEDAWASNSGGHYTEHELDMGELGLGYRFALSDRMDLIAEVAAVDVGLKLTRTERPFFGNTTPYTWVESDENSTTGRVAVGVRGSIADNLEGWAKAGFIGDNVYDSGFSSAAGLQFKFLTHWGIVGELEATDAWTLFRFGVRASF